MDDFREWVSDNLRYMLLGLAIIIVLVLLFFGIRFLTSVLGGSDEQKNVQEQQQEDPVEVVDPETTEEPTAEPTEEPVAEPTQEPVEQLEKNAYPEVVALIQNYYTALGSRDIEGLKGMVDQLDAEDESAIANSRYIAGYSSVECYTKKGLTDTSYVVLASYGHKYVGYDTTLPGVSCLYVDTKEDGSLYIVAEPSQEQQDRINTVISEADSQEFVSKKQQEYKEALASDADLKKYLEELGVEGSAAMDAENGSSIITKTNCNVRAKASADSDKIGELTAGQEVTKTGEDGDWIQIDFEGQTGYVRGDLFL